MSLGFDPLAFLVALFAIAYTIRESRKTNAVVIKVIECETTFGMSIWEPEPQHTFKIFIRNQGISLHDPRLIFAYRSPRGGSCRIPLKRRDEHSGPHKEFARGMIAEFGLKTKEIDAQTQMMFDDAKNFKETKPVLLLTSQGYLAATIKVFGLRERLVSKWNRFAKSINWRFDRTLKNKVTGDPMIKPGRVLPANFVELSMPLRVLICQGFLPAHDLKAGKAPRTPEPPQS